MTAKFTKHTKENLFHFLLLTFFVVFVSFVFQDLRAYAFSTCEKSSSTGVDRPKIVTDTRSLLFS